MPSPDALIDEICHRSRQQLATVVIQGVPHTADSAYCIYRRDTLATRDFMMMKATLVRFAATDLLDGKFDMPFHARFIQLFI